MFSTRGISVLAGIAFLVIGAATCLTASPWPKVDSDLVPMSNLHESVLPNGIHAYVLTNAEPKGHASLRLLVAAGSLEENDDERGLAHFVEHIAFRSTRSHPSGSLIPFLEQLGVGFGPDTAAFTGYDFTIYHLELADATEPGLRNGLRIFREFASEVTFDPKSIADEVGVIVSEAETRNTPAYRRDLINLEFLWPNSLRVKRPPIGRLDLVRQFRPEQFQAFYDAWYRPDRMAVLVVGDVDRTVAEHLINEQFGDLRPRGPARPEPDAVPRKARPSDATVYADPGLVGCVMSLEHPEPNPRTRDTHADRVRSLRLALANGMFQRRLTKLALNPKTTFVSPTTTVSDEIPGWRLITLSASGRTTDWQAVASDLEKEHRRAYLYGFTANELAEARNAMAAQYEQAARTFTTWSSEWMANQLAVSIRLGNAFISPAELQRDLAPELAACTVTDCIRAFRAAWTRQAPLVFVAANPEFHVTARQIGAALNRSRNEKVAPYTEPIITPFAYTSFGAPGAVAEEKYYPDLDARLTRFTNGVRCNFKSTTFESDTVLVHVRVGEGKLSQPRNTPGLDLFARSMLLAGGVGKHSIDQLTDLLATTTVRPEFHVESDAYVFSARCARRDLPLCLEVVGAFLTDAAYRTDALRAAQGGFGTMYAMLAASPGGPLAVTTSRILAGGDPRFGTPTAPELERRDAEELKHWLDPQLKHGAIELSIVGDVTWPEARTAVAQTLGALPHRSERETYHWAEKVQPPSPPVAPVLFESSPQLRQCGVEWVWPVYEVRGFPQQRRYYLLAQIVAERMRVRLRDQLGATYTPEADFSYVDGFPKLNWITCYAEVAPDQVLAATQSIETETTRLALEGPSPEEFERTKRVYVREMTDDLRSNGYWGVTVLGDAQQHPENLVAARNRATDIASISRAEMTTLAACLDGSNAFRFVTLPSGTPSPFRGPAQRTGAIR